VTATSGDDDDTVLWLPLAGPFLRIGEIEPPTDDMAGLGGFAAAPLVADGMAQFGGLVALAVGLASLESVVVRDVTVADGPATTLTFTGDRLVLGGRF
jgi:hypothetical protein